MAVLFPHLAFDPVETPLSFAARLAGFHTGGRVTPFLNDIGVKPQDLTSARPEALQRLCHVADVDPAPVLRNAFQLRSRRRYCVRGFEVSAEFTANPATVFCPACLLEDDAGGAPGAARRGRFLWTLRAARTCPRHGIALSRRPAEAWDDALHELATRVPERGADLEALVEAAARREVSPLQAYLADRLDGGAGPAWLDAQSLEQAARACEMLGVLLEFGPTPNLKALSPCEWGRAGRAGFAVAKEGEAGIREALHQVQAACRAGGGKPGPRKVFGRLYEWLAHSRTDKAAGDIKRIMREHIFETMELPEGREVLGQALPARRLHSVASLANEAGLDRRTLRNVLVGADLVPRSAAVGAEPAFDAEAGRRVAASVARSVHVTSLPKALGCTRPQADQLLDARILVQLCDADDDGAGRTRKAVDARKVAALLAGLRDAARPVKTVPAGMVPIAKAAEKAKTRSVEIVHLILGGFLSKVARLRDAEGIAALLVEPAEVRAAMRAHMPGLSAIEAFIRLNIPMYAGWALAADREAGPALKSITVVGPNRAHRFPRFDPQDVAVFRAEYVTATHIAAAMSVPVRKAHALLKRKQIQPALSKVDFALDFHRIRDLPEVCGEALAGTAPPS